MKNAKSYVASCLAALIMATGCSTINMSKQSDKFAHKKPYRHSVGMGTVSGWAYNDTIQTMVALDFEGREIILKKSNKLTHKLDESLPAEYAIGDTIYFRYLTKQKDNLDTIYANHLVK